MHHLPKIMKVIKLISCFMAITMALTLFLISTNKNTDNPPTQQPSNLNKTTFLETKPLPSKRVGRFLQQQGPNPRAADHCNKNNEICNFILDGRSTTCCNNKCIDTSYDRNNCGACRRKCGVTNVCCGGQCVNLGFDKRHCGGCNNRCKMVGGICIFGFCDYA